MIRRLALVPAAVLPMLVLPVAVAAAPATTPPATPPDTTPPVTTTAPPPGYVSNPTDDPSIAAYCADQAQLANNLTSRGDRDRAMEVVSEANMRGCRVYTFQASWSEGGPATTTTPTPGARTR